MKIESHDKRVDELLKGNTFLIPRFQRAYSWEADHVLEFWSDIVKNMSEAYFIGSMVVYKVERATLAVVDGQQRLTTITILLCAIREALKNIGEVDLAEGAADAPFEIGREEEAIERAYKIFKEQIGENVESFLSNKEQTKKESKKDATAWLTRLRDTIFDLNVI